MSRRDPGSSVGIFNGKRFEPMSYLPAAVMGFALTSIAAFTYLFVPDYVRGGIEGGMLLVALVGIAFCLLGIAGQLEELRKEKD